MIKKVISNSGIYVRYRKPKTYINAVAVAFFTIIFITFHLFVKYNLHINMYFQVILALLLISLTGVLSQDVSGRLLLIFISYVLTIKINVLKLHFFFTIFLIYIFALIISSLSG